MNDLIVGTWWFTKDEYGVHAYKGPNPPINHRCGENWEFNWMNFDNEIDYCWKNGDLSTRLTVDDLSFINTEYLNTPVSKVIIYPSGDYIIEDYDG